MTRIFIKNTGIGQSIDAARQPCYELYPQIHETLLKDLGPEYAAFFAEPVVDSRSNEIDWYVTDVDGQAELVAYADLDSAAQQQWNRRAADILAAIREIARRYLHSGITGQQAIGHALLAAASDSAPEDRYLFNGHPLVVFWGFIHHEETDTHGYLPDELAIVGSGSDTSTRTDSGELQLKEALPPFLFASRLLWIITLVAALVVVALVAVRSISVSSVQQVGFIQPPGTVEDATLIADIALELSREDAIRAELNELHERELKQACDCRLEQVAGRHESPTESATTQGTDLVVPEGAIERRDLSFLQGRWRSYTGLKRARDGKPIILEYEFGADGRGTSWIYERNPDVICSAPVVAVFNDAGQLLINDQRDLSCQGDNGSYNRSTVTCTIADNGHAACRGEQEGSSYSVRIRRKDQ